MSASIQTPFGHSLPPQGPHTITMHGPLWENAIKFRDGDASIFARLKSMYPRYAPFGPSALFVQAVGKKIKLAEGHTYIAFLSPDIWAANRDHAMSEFRKDKALKEDEFKYHVVEIDGIRLFLVEFPAGKAANATFMWQHAGLGFSTRLGEYLLPQVESLKYLGEFPVEGGGETVPSPSYLPENESHELLRKRIAGLLARGSVQEYAHPVKSDDVYLYQTGMATITRFHEMAVKARPEPVVVFGAIFHSTWHLFEEGPGGMKHYGKCDENDLNEFEKYLEEGGKCSYVFTEFPSNPILVSVDLVRLRKLADKYGFWITVDDTVSSFCNIDVLPAADVIVSSLTKSFSGYADLMAGSIVLNPNQSSYNTLKALLSQAYHNEFFAGDADQLLKNSDDYLPRSLILNRNAGVLAEYFHTLAEDPKMPVTKVCYPPYSPGSENLLPFVRKPTPDFPKVGYGCLLSVEFEKVENAIAFYDNINFHTGPHLGAHLTITAPYNALVYGKENPEYHKSYGMSQNQIRISVGLEDDVLSVCKDAIAVMLETEAQAKEGGD